MKINPTRLSVAALALVVIVVVVVAASSGNDERSSPGSTTSASERPLALSGYSNIHTVDIKLRLVRSLTQNRDEELAQGPSWSKKGRIAFTQAPSDESLSGLVTTGADGSDKEVVRTSVEHVFQPTWSPDGRKVAVVRLGFGIYSIDVRSGDARRLTTGEADEAPAWSPDGRRILFDKQVSGTNWDLFTVDSGGGHVRRLTRGPLQETNPTWSPDGSEIAFAQQRPNGNWVIYRMRSDGSGQEEVTNDRVSSQEPSWSPDGSRIAFIRQSGARAYLSVIGVDGTRPRRLTGESLVVSRPSWSPDGTKIVFSAKAASTDPSDFEGH